MATRFQSQRGSTFIGSGALVLWAVEPLVVSELVGFPLFQSLLLIFFSSFLLTATRVTIAGKWREIFSQPLFAWAFGTVAICGSDFAYMLGAFCAPIAHIDLIDYLWPCLIVVFIGFLPGEKFTLRHLIGACLGLAGVFELTTGGEGISGIDPQYILPYALAFVGVIIWGLYSTYSRIKLDIPVNMIGIYCGIGSVVCLIFHLSLEQTVMPTLSQGVMVVTLGLAGPGLAYQLWDYGMKFGDAKFLSVACYFARVAAMFLLVYFGKEPLSQSLILACALSIVGVVVCSVDGKVWKDLILLKWLLPDGSNDGETESI